MPRDISAFIIGFISLGLIPIYGQPFGGCSENPYLTLDPHCGIWPELLRSFIFITIVCFVSKSSYIAPLIGLVCVLLITTLGGFENITSGEVQVNDYQHLINNAILATPEIIGAVSAFFMYLFVFNVALKKSRG